MYEYYCATFHASKASARQPPAAHTRTHHTTLPRPHRRRPSRGVAEERKPRAPQRTNRGRATYTGVVSTRTAQTESGTPGIRLPGPPSLLNPPCCRSRNFGRGNQVRRRRFNAHAPEDWLGPGLGKAPTACVLAVSPRNSFPHSARPPSARARDPTPTYPVSPLTAPHAISRGTALRSPSGLI
jgi:hypothetical protein